MKWNFSAGSSIRKGWFSNTSFTTGLKTWQGFQPCCEAGIGEPTLSVVRQYSVCVYMCVYVCMCTQEFRVYVYSVLKGCLCTHNHLQCCGGVADVDQSVCVCWEVECCLQQRHTSDITDNLRTYVRTYIRTYTQHYHCK